MNDVATHSTGTVERLAPLGVPNVFISYECDRTETPASAIPVSIQETYAQCAEDLIVESLLSARLALAGRGLGSLFYIEIGANHPVQTSNSYLFYRKHGAAGVLVEANAKLIDDLRRVRPRDIVLHTAVSARADATVSFGMCDVSELSSLAFDHIESFGTGAGVATITVPNLHINDLLARHVDRPLDFLSIDVEGVDVEILEALDFSRFRPLVLQCEPSEHFAPGTSQRMVNLLHERGYTLVARTSINLIFIDSNNLAGGRARPTVNSFDVFDTLIARRCVDPLLVFDLVEAASGVAGFARARREAEVAVAGAGATLDEIYAELSRILGLDQAAAAALKQAEISAEMGQVIPIAENISRVKDGDLLLSDMYLPPAVVRALLDKAGLDRRVGLSVTTNGKQSGRIWPEVQANFTIGRHLGDNPLSDVAMPRRFGIPCEQTGVSEPTPIERWFLNTDLRPLGELMRAARLRIATQDPLERQLLLVQTQFNFPILFLASVALRRHAVAVGATRLLFSSRDCHLWHDLYCALFPTAAGTEYFYTSRRARVEPSSAYRAYARDRLIEGAILVDLCGSGWSSARLMETLDLHGRALYFLHQIAPIPLYEQQHPTPSICCVNAIIGRERAGLDHVGLEMSNYAVYGSVIGMEMLDGVPIPAFDIDNRSVAERALVVQQVNCFRSMVADARANLPSDSFKLGDADLADVLARLYALLSQESCLPIAFGVSHNREDMNTLGALRLLSC